MTRGLQSVVLMAAVCLLSGCATKALMKAANEPKREKFEGVVQLASASREGDAGYLCFRRTAPDGRADSFVLKIPTNGSRDFFVYDPSDQPAILNVMRDQVKPGPCDTPGRQMAVIELTESGQLALEKGQAEAVYVRYAEGSLRSLGYVSATPLYNKPTRYSYAINLSETDVLSGPGHKRPYLLALLPVTVAADVAVGVGYAAVFLAVVAVDSCAHTRGGCHGGR